MRTTRMALLIVVGLGAYVSNAFTTDVEIVQANLGMTSCFWNAETLLSPSLSLTPPRKTVVAGTEILFTAYNNTNPVSWFMTVNQSGGALNVAGAQTALYAAGTTSDCVDTVQVWDGINSFGRGYVNVISPDEVARCGKGILVAGRASSTDPVWPTTRYLANMGYNALRYRGYARENLRYLSPVAGADVDGDGLDNDIACTSTRANVGNTFTNWVGNADKLFVYLVDHGGESAGMGYFRLNANETFSAAELGGWLDKIQDAYTNEVVVVIDCCNSGSFVPWLAYSGPAKRIVITACSADEPTIFGSGGLISFSEAFFSGILHGLSVADAYAFAKSAMDAYQTALLDDTKDGVCDASDGAVADAVSIGATFVAGKDVPQIGLVLGNQQLEGDTVATLWASDVVAAYPISRVWCVVVPPDYQPASSSNPVTDLPQLELTYNSANRRYEAQYAGFSEEGTYKIIYYAKDTWESVSMPRHSYVVQSGFLERAIIVAGPAFGLWEWSDIESNADNANTVLKQRRLSTNAICYLSQQVKKDVDAVASRSSLMNAVTNWAKGSNKLTLYMVSGSVGLSKSFKLNGTEFISPSEIDSLLDGYQISNQTVTVVMDFDYSGSWLPQLAAPYRVNIASTEASRLAVFFDKGRTSFSRSFFANVQAGLNVWESFKAASKDINWPGKILGKQAPLMDSTGDGQYSPGTDQVLAKTLFLGSAFMMGADVPTLEAVAPDTVLESPGSVLLWASGVADIGGVSDVACVISGPRTGSSGQPVRVELAWNPETERFETLYDGFAYGGMYACTYSVADYEGQLSVPVQTLVEVTSADVYEPDNSSAQAGAFEIGTSQVHNRHAADDEDWIKFYAPSGYVFMIQATQFGAGSDLCLEVFYEAADGTLTFVDDSDWEAAGSNVVESIELPLAGDYQVPTGPGFYYVRVCSYDELLWGSGSEYELLIYSEQGGDESVIVVAVDKLNGSQPPVGAVLVCDGTNSVPFGASNSMLLSLPQGVHTIQVTVAQGYLPEQDPALQYQVANPDSYWYGNPKMTVSVAGSPRMAIFQFVPVVEVRGKVLNRLTGEPVAGASLAFKAIEGPLTGLTYDGYPNSAVYEIPWVTGADGAFPTNVWLPKSMWDVTVSRPSYTNLALSPAVEQKSVFSITNLGTLLLAPLDANGNGVADSWETQYSLSNVTGTSDADGDSFPDVSEYLAGTDPTNSLSLFTILEMIKSPAAESGVRWSTSGSRSYRVFWSDTPGTWPSGQSVLVGPTNAWVDPSTPLPAARFYRVGVELPQ